MVEKKRIDPLGTPNDSGSFSYIQPEFEECYADLMDSSFAALGRVITIHLTPEKTLDVEGLQANLPAVHYNPFMGRAPRRVPSNISTTRTTGVQLVHRCVEYIAKIKHGPKDANDKNGVELHDDEVLTTLVIAAYPHISECLGATIDGRRYAHPESVRPFGFRDNRYILVKWKRINEVEPT